jgi:hypothetical protein
MAPGELLPPPILLHALWPAAQGRAAASFLDGLVGGLPDPDRDGLADPGPATPGPPHAPPLSTTAASAAAAAAAARVLA